MAKPIYQTIREKQAMELPLVGMAVFNFEHDLLASKTEARLRGLLSVLRYLLISKSRRHCGLCIRMFHQW